MSSITVTPNLQNKSVSPTTSTQYIYPSSGYCGIYQVVVSAIQSQSTLLCLTGQPYNNDGIIFNFDKNYSDWKLYVLFGPNTTNFNGCLMFFAAKNINNKYDQCSVTTNGEGFSGSGSYFATSNTDGTLGQFSFNGSNAAFSYMAGSYGLYTGYNYYLYIVVN